MVGIKNDANLEEPSRRNNFGARIYHSRSDAARSEYGHRKEGASGSKNKTSRVNQKK